MLDEFKSYIQQHNIFKPEDPVILSVSGGIDSMVLCHLFLRSGFKFGIAHCNFQLRGQDSDDDEKFVNDFALANQIPFYSKSFSTKTYAKENQCSIQMAARELRINWLEKLIAELDYCFYATAHHKNDQIETLFINLFRGSGISGLRSIKPKVGKLIHPLLFAFRKNIETYAHNYNIAFREDKTNQETDYTRNKIRHNLIPEIKKIHDNAEVIIGDNIERLQSVETIYKSHVNTILKKISRNEKNRLIIDIPRLIKLTETATYLFEMLNDYGFNFSDAEQIIKSLSNQPGKVFYSPTHRLIIDRKELIVESKEHIGQGKKEYTIDIETPTIIEPVHLKLETFSKPPSFSIITDKNVALLDFSVVNFPLTLRKWRSGDIFYPLNMKGKKLVSDYFTDNKFSLIQKENTWILTSSDKIIWIIGHRMDDRFKVHKTTKKILKITLIQ